jgi:hypothetical protein
MSRLLERDVCKRLDVAGAMAHPWVSLGGSAPLPSCRDHQAAGGGASPGSCVGALEATQEEIDAAIAQIAGGGVSQLMDVVFAEKHLAPG